MSLRLMPKNQLVHGYRFIVRALFLWSGQKSDYIKNLAYALKYSSNSKIFESLALQFEIPKNLQEVLVPAPAKKRENLNDHAWQWGQALSHIVDSPLKNLLVRSNIDSQKTKKKEERHQLMFNPTGIHDY